MEHVEAVVVGAGVVGLAIARTLATAGRDVIVLEANETFGAETSSRNSEVIHAGIYYPEDSLKARLCVAGKEALYRYCVDRSVAHRRCGKLIVATDPDQVADLPTIQAKAMANGVNDLELLTPSDVREIEPEVRCEAALWSPSTGIIDSHGLMLSLLGDVEAEGGFVAFETPLERVGRTNGSFMLQTGGTTPTTITADMFINAAGHWAPEIARHTEDFPNSLVPENYYCKGNYYTLAEGRPFSRLVYPMPEKHGLGIHVTVDIGGSVRFGPDTEWIDGLNYDVDPTRADRFYESIRGFYPDLADNSLLPGYAGIRPKMSGPSGGFEDFRIHGPSDHGLNGHVAVFGIESPGLTACLAIGDMVAGMVSR